MISSLRNKQRVDNLQSESRGSRGTVGRWVYLILVGCLLLWLLDTLFGKYFFFRAEGMVTRDVHTMAVSYTATVENLKVEVGDQLQGGDLLVQLNSVDVLQNLGDLSIKSAEIRSRIAELQSRQAQLKTVLPLAQERVEKMGQLRSTEERAAARGLVDTRKISEYLEDEFDSRMTYEKLRGEGGNIALETRTLQAIDANLQESMQRLNAAYADGVVLAPEAVTVSEVYVNKGSVVKSGEPLLELLSGGPYILAYVTPGSVYVADVGAEVSIKYGLKTLQGKVAQIFPISARLPLEFQRAFRPQERSQVLRVEILPDQEVPATYTKVKVVAKGLVPNWIGNIFN
ncbi:MAG: hypothetical protein GYB33_14475 [Gammaproteobacteria bacterium]|nr:hypothetical protein [Gammaproteobacteria bacterium]